MKKTKKKTFWKTYKNLNVAASGKSRYVKFFICFKIYKIQYFLENIKPSVPLSWTAKSIVFYIFSYLNLNFI